jgi:hypothetical protein
MGDEDSDAVALPHQGAGELLDERPGDVAREARIGLGQEEEVERCRLTPRIP